MYSYDELRGGLRAALLPEPVLGEGQDEHAAVVVPVVEGPKPALVFTKRTEELARHPGEISFPGGLPHPEDRDLVQTALRETEEELGVPRADVEVLGFLEPLHTFVSGIWIVPVVGALANRPSFTPNPAEIAEVLEFPLSRLRAAEKEVEWARDGWTWKGFAYELDGHTIWGATGRILHGFLEVVDGIRTTEDGWQPLAGR